jgi:2-methylisocitrate lyase-like PEP mutase family enzyme
MAATPTLRALLARKEVIVAPGVYSALTAKLVARAGFSAAYMSGYCTAASRYGLPDTGLVTMTEMLDNVRSLAGAVEIPLIADGDTGYGNAMNVVRTVREYEAAGAAAIHIEDQVWPKRCGHMSGKEVIPIDEMTAKVRAAVDARRSADFVIIARTDAIAVEGLDAAIERCRAYADAGADVVFADGQQTTEHVERLPRAFPRVPCMINLGPLTPALSVADVQNLGYAIAVLPGICLAPAVRAIERALVELRDNRTAPAMAGEEFLRLFAAFNELLQAREHLDLDRKYRGAASPSPAAKGGDVRA